MSVFQQELESPTDLEWEMSNHTILLMFSCLSLPTKEAKELSNMGEVYSLESQAHYKTETQKQFPTHCSTNTTLLMIFMPVDV